MTVSYRYFTISLLISLFSIAIKGQSVLFEDTHGIEVSIHSHGLDVQTIVDQPGITIDHGSNHHTLNLYINKEGYQYLETNKIPFIIRPKVQSKVLMKTYDEIVSLKSGHACLPDLDYYPTYEAYEQLMYDFEANYPDICRIINIGTLNSGRKLLVAHISDNLEMIEDEPNFLYTSSMHGDELAGFPMMINLIDDLLCNYGSDERLTNLVDNINIFINPLANPNGTYRNDNSTVMGARRENGSFVDLNRNYPDAREGDNPDGRPYQEETMAFMQFSDDYNINMSANLHGGAELVNYPWDTFSERHADDFWWINVSRNYADTVHHRSPSGYLTDEQNGISNGFDWYQVSGSRQDHMTYFKRGREFTLELSDQKLLNSNLLQNYWAYNKDALINYLNESLYGLKGRVIDCQTGLPIKAEIIIDGHDNNNSSVFSNAENGMYFRYLDEGTYAVSYISSGYDTLTNIATIIDKSIEVINVDLCPNDISMATDNFDEDTQFIQSGNKILVKTSNTIENGMVIIYDSNGQKIMKSLLIDKSIEIAQPLPIGIYNIQLYTKHHTLSKKLLIK